MWRLILCQLDWAKDAQTASENISGCASECVSRRDYVDWVKEVTLASAGGVSSNRLRAWIEQKSGGRTNLFSGLSRDIGARGSLMTSPLAHLVLWCTGLSWNYTTCFHGPTVYTQWIIGLLSLHNCEPVSQHKSRYIDLCIPCLFLKRTQTNTIKIS